MNLWKTFNVSCFSICVLVKMQAKERKILVDGYFWILTIYRYCCAKQIKSAYNIFIRINHFKQMMMGFTEFHHLILCYILNMVDDSQRDKRNLQDRKLCLVWSYIGVQQTNDENINMMRINHKPLVSNSLQTNMHSVFHISVRPQYNENQGNPPLSRISDIGTWQHINSVLSAIAPTCIGGSLA